MASPSKLQGTYNSSAGQVTSLAYGSNVTLNSLLICIVFWQTESNIPTVSDSLGNTWSELLALYDSDSSGKSGVGLYWALNTKGNGVANTVDVNYNNSGTNYCGLEIDEWSAGSGNSWSGADGAGQIRLQTGIASPGTFSSGTGFTTASNGDLVIGAVFDCENNNPTMSIGSGFSVLYNNVWTSAGVGMATEYLIQASAGNTIATFGFTDSESNGAVTLCGAFKFTASGGGMNQVQEMAWWRNPYKNM
jgi:hypothetical protein